jgi:cell wall-associated NlpC family hydrolase
MTVLHDPTDIIDEARTWLGVRWQHQGRSRAGVDCVGLPIMVFKATRASVLDFTGYPRQAQDESMLQILDAHLDRIPLADMAPGDLVRMRFENQRHLGLLGDYAGGGLSLIHAHIHARRVVEHRLDDAWRARIMTAHRWRAVSCS